MRLFNWGMGARNSAENPASPQVIPLEEPKFRSYEISLIGLELAQAKYFAEELRKKISLHSWPTAPTTVPSILSNRSFKAYSSRRELVQVGPSSWELQSKLRVPSKNYREVIDNSYQ